jgi:hypothetical protein
MENTINTINDILDSELFLELFDVESEKKEIEKAGWNHNELIQFGTELSKLIK